MSGAKTPLIVGAFGCCSLDIFAGIFMILFFVGIFVAVFMGGSFDSSSANDNTSGDPGNLANVKDIPASLKPIFSAAGAKFNVQPAFIAAIFYTEHGKSFPTHGPWASSPVGASGPFQFMPGTWAGHKQDGNGDGVMDVQNLWDASFGAAHLLSAIGAGHNTTKISDLQNAASKYNSGQPWSVGQGYSETARYVPIVIEEFKHLMSQM